MKCSKIYFFGMFGLGAYATAVITAGSPKIASYGERYSHANHELQDTKHKYNVASKAESEARNKLHTAEQIVHDATCYIEHSSNFLANLNKYCQAATPDQFSINTLHIVYGITLGNLEDRTIKTEGSDSFQECQTSYKWECDLWEQNCKYILREHCKYVTYHFPQYTHEHRGSTASGSGSQVQIKCGEFSNEIKTSAIVTSTTSKWKTSYEFLSTKISQQNRDRFYKSVVEINTNVDNQSEAKPIIIEIKRTDPNLAATANSILDSIDEVCHKVISSLKPITYYKDKLKTAEQSLPQLHKDLAKDKVALEQATEYKKIKQDEFNSISNKYWLDLFLFLLALSPTVIIGICLRRIERECQYSDYHNIPTYDSNTIQAWKCQNPFRGCFNSFKKNSHEHYDYDINTHLSYHDIDIEQATPPFALISEVVNSDDIITANSVESNPSRRPNNTF